MAVHPRGSNRGYVAGRCCTGSKAPSRKSTAQHGCHFCCCECGGWLASSRRTPAALSLLTDDCNPEFRWTALHFGLLPEVYLGQVFVVKLLAGTSLSLHQFLPHNTTPQYAPHSSACCCCCCAAGLACLRMLGTSPALEMVNCLRASLSSFVAWIFLATASIRRCITTGCCR